MHHHRNNIRTCCRSFPKDNKTNAIPTNTQLLHQQQLGFLERIQASPVSPLRKLVIQKLLNSIYHCFFFQDNDIQSVIKISKIKFDKAGSICNDRTLITLTL